MTIYSLRPDPETSSLEDAEVVEESRYGWSLIEEAISLWRLVNPARADALEALRLRIGQAANGGELRIWPAEGPEMVQLLTDLDAALVSAGVIDAELRVPPVKLEELARAVPTMDLKSERTLEAKQYALAEVLFRTDILRRFVSDAAKSGCVVAFG